jgi:hypothetical protein
MTEVEALMAIADSIKYLAGEISIIGVILLLMLIFKKMG